MPPRPRAWRRGRLGARSIATLVVVAAVTTSAAAPQAPRLWGGDRAGTAVAVAEDAFPGGVGEVVVVNGTRFSDALAAAPLAAARGGALLLVDEARVPPSTAAELRRLSPDRIWVVGGPTVISEQVEAELAALAGASTERLGGTDRYATAATIAGEGFVGPTPEVFVASGEGFADSLSGGAAAAALGAPLLLTRRDQLPDTTADVLRAMAPTRTTLVGGPSAVSGPVEARLALIGPGVVVRLAGGDRYGTAAAVVLDTWESAPRILLASGAAFPDALAGAALGAPLLLSRPECQPEVVLAAQRTLHVERATGLGGAVVLSEQAIRGVPCS